MEVPLLPIAKSPLARDSSTWYHDRMKRRKRSLKIPKRTPDPKAFATLRELEKVVAALRSGLSPEARRRCSWS